MIAGGVSALLQEVHTVVHGGTDGASRAVEGPLRSHPSAVSRKNAQPQGRSRSPNQKTGHDPDDSGYVLRFRSQQSDLRSRLRALQRTNARFVCW